MALLIYGLWYFNTKHLYNAEKFIRSNDCVSICVTDALSVSFGWIFRL